MLKRNTGKKGAQGRLASFAAGALTSLAIVGTVTPALASNGALALSAYPTQVLVEGQEFRPATGLVFMSDGTTYAPVRALAEAYGLEVGYDAAKNLVTVGSGTTQTTGAQFVGSGDFGSQWTVKQKPVTGCDETIFTASYSGPLGMDDFKQWWKSLGEDAVRAGAEKLAADAQSAVGGSVTMYLDYNGWALGTVYAYDSFEQSDLRAAGVWIK